MSNDKIFADGLILKSVETQYWELQTLSVKVEDFKNFLDQHENNWWVNLNIKKSKWWKDYIELNTYKKTEVWGF